MNCSMSAGRNCSNWFVKPPGQYWRWSVLPRTERSQRKPGFHWSWWYTRSTRTERVAWCEGWSRHTWYPRPPRKRWTQGRQGRFGSTRWDTHIGIKCQFLFNFNYIILIFCVCLQDISLHEIPNKIFRVDDYFLGRLWLPKTQVCF